MPFLKERKKERKKERNLDKNLLTLKMNCEKGSWTCIAVTHVYVSFLKTLLVGSLLTLFRMSNALVKHGRHVTLPPYVNLNRCRDALPSTFPAFDIPYHDRLVQLGLDSLELRRFRTDLVYVYQIPSG